VEFPGLFPTNPPAWQARNWIEILHQHRTDWFDTGEFKVWADIRATGHAHNWAVPGATTSELKSLFTNFFNQWWVNSLKNHIRFDVERVVIFAGGNDADSYYANLYNGLTGPEVTNTTLSNLQWLAGWVRGLKPSMPIVLVSVPHVGCTPKVQQGYPTDPVKTARVTAAMDSLNTSLAAWAQTQGIGFVPGVYAMTKALITDPFRLNGIEFYRVADADARPRYVFSGDGFHPSTCAHAKIAQLVVQAFNTAYPATTITPLDDDYLTTTVLGLDPNLPFNEWMTAQGFSGSFTSDSNGNGVPNLIEFALDQPAMPQPVMQNGALSLTYRPRTVFTEWGTLKVQSSTNLLDWIDVPENQIITNPDGTRTVSTAVAAKAFLRFQALP
jgi:lysophospholipase L1-like esterase